VNNIQHQTNPAVDAVAARSVQHGFVQALPDGTTCDMLVQVVVEDRQSVCVNTGCNDYIGLEGTGTRIGLKVATHFSTLQLYMSLPVHRQGFDRMCLSRPWDRQSCITRNIFVCVSLSGEEQLSSLSVIGLLCSKNRTSTAATAVTNFVHCSVYIKALFTKFELMHLLTSS
jgi:hypothetical protein